MAIGSLHESYRVSQFFMVYYRFLFLSTCKDTLVLTRGCLFFNCYKKGFFHLQPRDPAAKALSAKNKGNKYFKGGRYELAIKCYTQAIEVCPQGKSDDLSTFYQNRAAAFEQLVRKNLVSGS